jgi:hypothetical protein
VTAPLANAAVCRILDEQIGGVRLTHIPGRLEDLGYLMRYEEDLGKQVGCKPREVRHYVRMAYSAWDGKMPNIRSCAQFTAAACAVHRKLKDQLQSSPKSRLAMPGKRPVDRRAEELTFAIGVMTADPCKRTAFPLSYMVACSLLSQLNRPWTGT